MAAQFLLGQRYVDAFEQQARKENIIIAPTKVNGVQEQVEISLNMLKK